MHGVCSLLISRFVSHFARKVRGALSRLRRHLYIYTLCGGLIASTCINAADVNDAAPVPCASRWGALLYSAAVRARALSLSLSPALANISSTVFSKETTRKFDLRKSVDIVKYSDVSRAPLSARHWSFFEKEKKRKTSWLFLEVTSVCVYK